MEIEFTGEESVEEMEALLAKFESAEVVDEQTDDGELPAVESIQNTDTKTEAHGADTGATSAVAGDNVDDQTQGDTPKGIAAKDGEHVIPYDVLEREREANRQLKEQIDAMQAKNDEYEQTQRLLSIRDKQLEKLGVAPQDLPENVKLTEEQLDALDEDYPEIGGAIRALAAQVNAFQSAKGAGGTNDSSSTANTHTEQPTANHTSADPVLDAINANQDLAAWRKSGGEQWNKAIELDDQLRADPQWANKPMAERFDEAARRTKAHFDQQVKDKAAAAEDAAKQNALPNSPSELGSTNRHSSLMDKAANASSEELQALMSGMSDDEINAFLSNAS
ncbi:hypothetical protein AB8599_08910 [Enterovibrio sp. 27052020O]